MSKAPETETDLLEQVMGRYVTSSQGIKSAVVNLEQAVVKMESDNREFRAGVMASLRDISTRLERLEVSLTARQFETSRLGSVGLGGDDEDGEGRFTSGVYALAALVYSAIHLSMEDNDVKRDRLVVPKRSRFCSVCRYVLKASRDGYVPQVPDNKNPKTVALMQAMMVCGPSSDLFTPCSRREVVATVGSLGDTWTLALAALIDRLKICRHLLPQEMAWGLDHLDPKVVSDGRLLYCSSDLPETDADNVLLYKRGVGLKDALTKEYVEKTLKMSREEIAKGENIRLLQSMA